MSNRRAGRSETARRSGLPPLYLGHTVILGAAAGQIKVHAGTSFCDQCVSCEFLKAGGHVF